MATIEITVKTLDSQNHKFDVADTLTVKQFKEVTAEIVNVAVESQRLIYCGRVLHDDKMLSEYDLDKKVVHLVQKLPPPRPSGPSSGTSTPRSTTGPSPRRSGTSQARAQGQDGSMYLGALAFPPDIFSLQEFIVAGTHDMIQHATASRLNLVQTMLRRAENCVSRLEDPTVQRSVTPPPPSAAAPTGPTAHEEHVEEQTFQAADPLLAPGEPHDHQNPMASDTISGAVTAAVAGALSAIVSAVGNTMGTPNITIMQQGGATNGNQQTTGSSTETRSSATSTTAPAQPQSNIPSSTFTSTQSSQPRRPPADMDGRRQVPVAPTIPVRAVAEVLDQVLSIQDRLRPFIQRTSRILRADAVMPPESPVLQDAQRTFALVSESLHLLSHAYHSLSDLSVGLGRPPPRTVGVRSLVLQPAAVLQAGFPIQAQINVMTNRTSPSSPTRPGQTGGPRTTSSGPIPASTPASATAAPPTAPSSTSGATPDRGLSGFSLSPGSNMGNLELIMEVGPSGFTLEHASLTPMQAPNTTSSTTSTPTGQPTVGMQNLAGPRGGMNAMGMNAMGLNAMGMNAMGMNAMGMNAMGMNAMGMNVPPPELIQNIMQAMAAQMMGGSPASGNVRNSRSNTTTSSSTTTTSASAGAQAAAGQTSQARGNTATYPTTSTQTRSTARPHVHLAPVNWPGGHNPQSFDPFLPCNSHHIQPTVRLQSQQAQGSRTRVGSQDSARLAANRRDLMNIAAEQLLEEGLEEGFTEQQGFTERRGFNEQQNFMDLQSGTTIAEFLSVMPDYTYTEGESLFADLFVVVARLFTFRDMVQVSLQQSAPLNRLREPLRDFILEHLLHGNSPESMNRAVDRLMVEVRPYLEIVLTSQLREDIEYEATVHQFCVARVPELIRLIVNADPDDSEFGSHLMRLCSQFVRDLASLTLMCCHGGRQGLERILHRYVQILTLDLEPSIQQWTSVNSRLPLRSFVRSLANAPEHLQGFLVRSNTNAPFPASAPPSTPPSTPAATQTVQSQLATATDREVAMELEEEIILALEVPSSQAAVTPVSAPVVQGEGATALPLPPMEVESTCDVVVGSEEWHAGIEPDWVPVITRDMQRQRRSSDQPPFSDSYLAGMSSKRRKVITNSKPQGTVSQVIAESVVHAAGAAGVGNADQLTTAASEDTTLQAAYKEEVKKSVSQQLANNPDFTPDRFPNASKYFDPPK